MAKRTLKQTIADILIHVHFTQCGCECSELCREVRECVSRETLKDIGVRHPEEIEAYKMGIKKLIKRQHRRRAKAMMHRKRGGVRSHKRPRPNGRKIRVKGQ